MLFAAVVGQMPARAGLLKMWRDGVLPHALLITGKEGTGSLPLALALAQYIFCENKLGDDSCGKCPGCSKASKLEHADLHLSFPSIPPKPNTKAMSRHFMQEFREFVKQTPYGSTYDWLQHINAENKQGNITADECREIIESLNLKSYEGGHKVLIMWRPEYLGKEGNILLKLIEEPPANTIMIFAAENTEDILPTILSRTQEVKLAPIAAADIASALVARSGVEQKLASQIAHVAMGSYTEALRLVREPENDLLQHARQLFNAIFTRNGAGISAFVEEWAKAGREQQKNFLTYLAQLMELALRATYRQDAASGLPEAEARFILALAGKQLSIEEYLKLTGEINKTTYYIERNAHAKTQLHALCIKLQYIVNQMEIPV